jgi:hypothetical protein
MVMLIPLHGCVPDTSSTVSLLIQTVGGTYDMCWVTYWQTVVKGVAGGRLMCPGVDCYAPSGAQGSPTWTMCSHSRPRQGQGRRSGALLVSRDQRSTTKYGVTTRSSPAPERDCFRVLWGREERGEGVGRYSSQLGLEPGMDTAT